MEGKDFEYDVEGKDGIYVDKSGARYKKTRAGVRYPVDASGTRTFKYADGRAASRPAELDSLVWEMMSKRKRKNIPGAQSPGCRRRAEPGRSGRFLNPAPGSWAGSTDLSLIHI